MKNTKTGVNFWFECTQCGEGYEENRIRYLCPVCSKENTASEPPLGVLKTLYDYPDLKKKYRGFSNMYKDGFLGLMPLGSINSLPNLHIGNTPLYSIKKLKNNRLPFRLYFKDDSQNPTFSFKDRASALVSAYAKEKSYNTIVTASTGNAGSSLAGICASQGQQAIVIVPENAPLAKLTQILMYGARLIPIKGSYDDAFDLSIKASEEFGWHNRNTAYNPLTIEGKKSVAFELFHQLNEKIPDRIFVPVGDGVILSGVYKGFEDLLELGIIDRIPVLVAVQSEGSNNLVRNISSDSFQVKKSHTLADSISVDIPRNYYMARQFMKEYQGETISITDEDILKASKILAEQTGLFTEPAAAAAFAGMLTYWNNDILEDNSSNVVLLTGSGLKDLGALKPILGLPGSIYPTMDELKRILP